MCEPCFSYPIRTLSKPDALLRRCFYMLSFSDPYADISLRRHFGLDLCSTAMQVSYPTLGLKYDFVSEKFP